MKSLLLPLTDAQSDQWSIERAIDLVADLDAHLTALLVDGSPTMVPAYSHYQAMSHYPLLLQQLEEQASARHAQAKSALEEPARR